LSAKISLSRVLDQLTTKKKQKKWLLSSFESAGKKNSRGRFLGNIPGWEVLYRGCQIFLGTIYQNEEKYTKFPQNIPIVQKISNCRIYTKRPYNVPTSSIAKTLQNLPNLRFFLSENIPTGYPVLYLGAMFLTRVSKMLC
jgi:hypothetical protein